MLGPVLTLGRRGVRLRERSSAVAFCSRGNEPDSRGSLPRLAVLEPDTLCIPDLPVEALSELGPQLTGCISLT